MNASCVVNCNISLGNGSANWMDNSKEEGMFNDTPEARIVLSTFSVIFLGGVLGNAVLLFHLCRRRWNSPHDTFAVNLAVGDILMVTIAMPFLSTIYIFTEWPFGEVICKFSEFVHTLSMSITVLSITALCVERFRILTLSGPRRKKNMSVIVLFLIWMTSFMIALPDLVSAEILKFGAKEYCIPFKESLGEAYAKAIILLKLLLLFILPFIVMALFYIIIAFKLLFRTSETSNCLDNNVTSEDLGDREQRIRLAVLVLVLVFIFVISWLPRHVYLMWYYFDTEPYNESWHVIKMVGVCLMYFNSALNPVVFLAFDSNFRKFICCRKGRFASEHEEEYSVVPRHTTVLTEFSQQDGEVDG